MLKTVQRPLSREADTVWLSERATERNLKTMSRQHKLTNYKVVHFATHGLLAGESETILKARAEPALVLTPPPDGVTTAELEEDDGLLTASEVAQLELDADWVVLSACNTTAGEKGDAEALSGLARAFFYAKARALLVSHWYVNSDAAVKLTTRASLSSARIRRLDVPRRCAVPWQSSLPRARRTRHILPLGHRSCWWAKEPDSTWSHGSQSWRSVAIGQVSEGVLMCLRRSGHA